MTPALLSLIATYIAVNIAVFIIAFTADCGFSFVNPVIIYKNVKMNWVGVILLTIILNLLFTLASICYWIYKLLTVGRKDD